MSYATTTPLSTKQETDEPHTACPCGNDVCHCAIEVLRDRGMQALLLASKEDVSDQRLRFVPRESILQEIRPDFISRVLQRAANTDDDIAALVQEATNRISARVPCHCKQPLCTGSRVIFASLLFSGLHRILVHFIHAAQPEICDNSLLERLNEGEAGVGDGDPIFRQIQQLQDAQKDHMFFYWIYQLIPLCFPKNGDDGQVKKLELNFALKTLLDDWNEPGTAKRSFYEELENNNAVPRGDRILSLLAALEHRGNFYFLFPLAELGDLQNIWKGYGPSRNDETGQYTTHAAWYSPQWLLEECLGIASALAHVHGRGVSTRAERFLLHADIKPDNILGFRDGDSVSLKLADFGHSHILTTAFPDVTVSTLVKSRSYRAPEFDVSECVTTKYDVWSLGCLFLDFVTWALLGWKEVEEFREQRLVETNDPKADYGSFAEDTFFKRLERRLKDQLHEETHV
ncbi:protein kinase domain-containing protein [Apiospora phragmitis]|uniref:Protein kinase domain-containing protein n=1 Tax=Apiospora phragmitis TaxID=2905665 RepID=A0ABR1WTF7_9PEZI